MSRLVGTRHTQHTQRHLQEGSSDAAFWLPVLDVQHFMPHHINVCALSIVEDIHERGATKRMQ